MAYVVLARKYRPATFEAFVGQEVIAETLRNAIRLDRVAHAYLFCGPRGVGKTSMARVFAKALNCAKGPTTEPCGKCDQCRAIAGGEDVDVIEIDGASNRGIDEVRDIRQNVRYAPAHSRLKIYYIDEVHMLTDPAFNALLKTLEEPPAHVKFIFATTAAAKLPETILSRVQRFDFRRISANDIVGRLEAICKAEKLKISSDVLALVARRARGSMRDALSLLDEIIPLTASAPHSAKGGAAAKESDYEKVTALLGTLGDDELARLMKMVREKDAPGLLKAAAGQLRRGMDVGELLDELLGHVRDLLVAKTCGAEPDLLGRPPEAAAALVEAAKEFSADRLLYVAETLNAARRRIHEGQDDRIVVEMTLVKLAQSDGLAPIGDLIERLAALEEGAAPPATPAAQRPAAQGLARAASPPASHPAASSGRSAASSRTAPADEEQEGLAGASWRKAPEDDSPSAVREEAPAPVASADELWPRLLEELRGDLVLSGSMVGGRFERVEKREVVIALPDDRPAARQELEKRENRAKLQQILERLLGRPVALRFAAAAAAPAPKDESEAPREGARIRKLTEKFGGRTES